MTVKAHKHQHQEDSVLALALVFFVVVGLIALVAYLTMEANNAAFENYYTDGPTSEAVGGAR